MFVIKKTSNGIEVIVNRLPEKPSSIWKPSKKWRKRYDGNDGWRKEEEGKSSIIVLLCKSSRITPRRWNMDWVLWMVRFHYHAHSLFFYYRIQERIIGEWESSEWRSCTDVKILLFFVNKLTISILHW